MNLKLKAAIILLLFLICSVFGEDDKTKKMNKPNQNDHYTYIAANNILMWISNNGDGSHDPRTDANGFYWPGGVIANKNAIYEDGLLYGAKVNNEIRVIGNTHRQGLQAGKIINGSPDDPSLEKYRVYKIKKGWEDLPPGSERDAYEKDYSEWPIEDGAPYIDVNGDGKPTPGIDKPKHIGDETLWYVANDLDPVRTRHIFGADPMGLEFQTTVFAFNNTSGFNDVVFKKYRIINKGNNVLKDMILSYWSDPDLGDTGDDYAGSDTLLNLGYVWNSDNMDGNGTGSSYGTPPPAVGYILLQGPIISGQPSDSAMYDNRWIKSFKNIPMTAFVGYTQYLIFRDPQQGTIAGSIEMYNYMQGKTWDGTQIIDPHTGNAVTKMLAGDPVSGTGWYEGTGWPGGPTPGDRRLIISSGTFNMSPGDTQEVVIGIVMGRGSSNVNSIAVMKGHAQDAIKLFNNSFELNPPVPDAPILHSVPMDRKITLWWENNVETYSVTNAMLPDTIRYYSNLKDLVIPVPDKNCIFEGYRIWQFSDKEGNNPKVIATIDIYNGIKVIKHFLSEYLGSFVTYTEFANGEDTGISRYKVIDNADGRLLNNGSPYYFAVTSYAYSKYSDPPVIESKPNIIEVIPGRPPIDVQYTYSAQSNIFFEHIEGNGDGEVFAKVIDPNILNGHEYEISFTGDELSSSYYLVDKASQDTLIAGSNDYSTDSLRKDIINGFTLVVNNIGQTKSLFNDPTIKSVQEIKGPGGIEITPVDVFSGYEEEKLNSTVQWTLTSVNENQSYSYQISNLNYLGFDYENYEIRFTQSGSEYYTTGYHPIGPIIRENPKGKGKVPFEVWRIPNDTLEAPQRLVIKIFDKQKDTSWSYINGEYESIYTFIPKIPYPEVLPPTSNAELGATIKLNYRICNLLIKGQLPAEGTVIKFTTWKPLTSSDKFTAVMTAPKLKNTELAKKNINAISAFPNPYFRANLFNQDYPEYIRFTNLPQKITIRLFSLAGVFIKKIEKDDEGQYADWDLKNKDGYRVASGVYLAYLEIPGTAVKVMKIALVD